MADLIQPHIACKDLGVEVSQLDVSIMIESTAAFLRRARESKDRPLVGEFLELNDGELVRFTHAYNDSIQTAPAYSGSYYIRTDGTVSYSGGLDPAIPFHQIESTRRWKAGQFWFFHDGLMAAHSGVTISIPVRVFVMRQ